MPSSAATRLSTRSASTSSTSSFWYGVVRTRCDPCSSAISASRTSVAPSTRPTVGAIPTKNRPSFCSWTPMWSPVRAGAAGDSQSTSLRSR